MFSYDYYNSVFKITMSFWKLLLRTAEAYQKTTTINKNNNNNNKNPQKY